MPDFTIEKETFDKKITISAEDGEKSGRLEYNVENIPLCCNEKTKIKKIAIVEYRELCDEAEKINLLSVYNENFGNGGLDGWTLKFALQSGLTKLQVELWCPDENKEKPETKKLLSFCEKVFELCDDERKETNV